jgi:hypothetical protein
MHDFDHWSLRADDSFDGELTVLRHTLTPKMVRTDRPLAQFLASEIIGQAAYALEYGIFGKQIIAANILDLI